jgi:crossover junction endodeoxyribonuclease RuvC
MRRNLPQSTTSGRRAASAGREGTTGHEPLIVLGIDPGTLVTGYGVVARRNGMLTLVACGAIKNPSDQTMSLRLKKIFDNLQKLIATFHPDECAIESAFYGKNAQSALKLGHARGVAMLAAVQQQIPMSEYSPREVKKSVVGNGAASKEQVQYMVRSLLHLPNSRMVHDASDAVAIALCHLNRLATPSKRFKDWKSFVTTHPDRVRS